MSEPLSLRADCERCFGLCCVVPAFAASADFAIDKPAGHACPNLRDDFRCRIHSRLREKGFRGCTVYDCFGAGQRVSQVIFGGTRDPRMQEVFPVVRQVHEWLWYLNAADAPGAEALRTDLEHVTDQAGLDEYWPRVRQVLREVSGDKKPMKKDLAGRNLAGWDLRDTDLRGAMLIGANLTDADLRGADLIGADLRSATVHGANLSTSLFVTQPQLDSAIGDAATKLPSTLRRPEHWHETSKRPGKR